MTVIVSLDMGGTSANDAPTALANLGAANVAAYAQANTARTQANTAYAQANAAYTKANNASGGFAKVFFGL